MGRFAVPAVIVSTLILLGGLTAGVVSAIGPTPPPLTATPDETVTQTVASDRAALVALYNATGGPNWRNNVNWLSNAPLGEWYGVGTGISGRVVGLELYGNGLSGTIPSELSRLANLRTLWLYGNQLSGEIPAELGNLANLESLLLQNNQLNGEIPPELGDLANLDALWIDNNQLSGEIPPGLGDLANLESLLLSSNQLSGEIPSEFGNLANLESLLLQNNQLNGEIPPELGDLTNLRGLALYSNQLSGEIPPGLGNLANLQSLDLSSNQLSGEMPAELGNLANLRELYLSSNQLTGEIPSELGNLANLEFLVLHSNQLSGEMPAELGNLANLRELYLSSNQLTGEIPSELGNLANLEFLVLHSNQLSGEMPAELGNLANLRELYLSSNQLTGEIPSELGNLANLEFLVLHSNQLSGEMPAELGNLANLRELYLSSNQLTGEIPSELGNLANLRELYLSSNQLTGEIPSELGNLANLDALSLDYNQLTGEIPPELGNLTNLHTLWLYSNQLTGEIPSELGNIANLQWLYLSNNRLEGCIPRGLDGVENNDLGRLELLFCRVPGPPNITALIIAGDNSLTIAWAAPASGPAVTAYDLRYVRTDADETVESNWNVVEDVWTGAGALRYVLNGLAAGTQYDVQVRAVSPGGNSPWSGTVSGTPLGRVEDGDSLGNKVTGVKVEATPNIPNAFAKWTVQFVNGDISSYWYDGTNNKDQDDNILDGGTGKDVIGIEFEDDVQFPIALLPNDIIIATNMAAEADGTVIERTVVANPLGVDIIKVSQFEGTAQTADRPPDETLVTLEIPDMEPASDRPGSQGIAPGATVTVTFRQTAGIKNPTESKADEVYQAERAAAVDSNGNFDASLLKPLSGYKVQVATSNNGYFVPAALGNRAVIPRRLLLSDMEGPRGSTVTVVGLGFRNSITAAIWNDKNQNGVRDSGEIDLGFALVTGSDDFTANFTIGNPPFSPDVGTNGINAVDGRNRTIIPGRRYMGAVSGITSTESVPKYLLESSIIVNPSTAAVGDTILVTGRDFVAGGNTGYARISIGSAAVTEVESTIVSDVGDVFFEITIPEGAFAGVQNLVIRDGPDAVSDASHDIVNGEGARARMVITGVIPRTLDTPIIRTPIIAGDYSLTVTWRAPIETRGLTPITYDLRYIPTDADETVEANWTLVDSIWKIGFYPLEYVLTGLTAGAQYDVQLRAVNAGGNGPWSATATGTPSTWGAIRYLSQTYVEPGGEVAVAIIATGYGLYGHVVETLPPGFSYTGSDLNEDEVIVSGREVIFFLYGQEQFTYTVTAPTAAGGGGYQPPPPPTPTPAPRAAGEYLPTPTPTPRSRTRTRSALEYSFSGSLVNENRLQQTVGGAASIRVGVEPLVNAFSFSRALVRIDAPIQVLVTFSEPVFGFTVDDIVVANGSIGNFAGSDSSVGYAFDVTPNAAGAVTVDIAAGAATDSNGYGNASAPQLSLGIPYDDDHDGGISKEEAITAVIDYFAGRITKEEAIAVIILYFSS